MRGLHNRGTTLLAACWPSWWWYPCGSGTLCRATTCSNGASTCSATCPTDPRRFVAHFTPYPSRQPWPSTLAVNPSRQP
eukprot:6685788-Pyramimonas_sp.AAC.1